MQIERIPLKRRLQQITPTGATPLAIFEVFIDDYFTGLARISNDIYFINLYENVISNEDPLYEKSYFLTSVPQALDVLPPKERDALLLKILVEPFARLQEKEEQTYESIFEDA